MLELDGASRLVLYVDDEPAALATFENNFRRDFTIRTAGSGAEALRCLEQEPVAVLIADQRMPEMQGVELIERARAIRPYVVPIILTGYADPESLKDAINRGGVFHYVDKPWKRQHLGQVIRRALDHHELAVENARLTHELRVANAQLRSRNEALATENADLRRETRGKYVMVGDSPPIHQLREQIARAAPHRRATVLILGETGTGKEVVAHAIHQASPRRDGPFIRVNCSTIPRELVESELFGHEKGAFTGATSARQGRFGAAHGGTIFLDEIGDLPLDVQPKLLRVLEQGEIDLVGSPRPRQVDVRVIAATNRDLVAAVREHAFREDLYERLNVVQIVLPPLRERREDIPALVQHFLELESPELLRAGAPGITEKALALLSAADYPGNVRGLRNLVVRTLIAFPDEAVLTEAEFLECMDQRPLQPAPALGRSYRERRDAAERQIFEEALGRHAGNKRQAARELGITEQGLYKALKRLGMVADDGAEPA